MTVTWKTNDHATPLEGLCSHFVEEIASLSTEPSCRICRDRCSLSHRIGSLAKVLGYLGKFPQACPIIGSDWQNMQDRKSVV